MVNFDAIGPLFEQCEREDALRLARFDNRIEKARLFDRAVDMMSRNTDGDAIHLHAHGGTDLFASKISERNIRRTILSIYPNPETAKYIMDTFRTRGSVSSKLVQEGEHAVRREYALSDKKLQSNSFRNSLPGMWTIHDDIRSAGVLRAILGDRKIQSASMLFAIPTKAMLFQAPYEIPREKTPPEVLKQRIGFVRHALMNAMFTTTAEIMEPAGTLLMGWFVKAGQNHPEYIPKRDVSGLRFWDQYTARMPVAIFDDLDPFPVATAVIVQFVRNSTPWDGDGKGQ